LPGAPRADPYVRNYRIRLLPWVNDADVLSRSRTLHKPRDLDIRCCVRSKGVGGSFPLVSPLPSADSAGTVGLPLFAGFFGTMELSDFPATCTPAVWHLAFAGRSASMEEANVAGISRLP